MNGVKLIWGETCFAEYRPLPEGADPSDQPWQVMKYDSKWSFRLDRETDVIELMRRLDERARAAKPIYDHN